MPTVTARDGVALHVETRGEGPLVVIAHGLWAPPEVFAGLSGDLATHHRVLTYDARGTGRSDRRGPYDLATDAADLVAVVEAACPGAVVIGNADSSHRAIYAGREAGSDIAAVLTHNDLLSGLATLDSPDALAESALVLRALLQMAETGFRSAVHTLMESTNPDFGETEVQRRVEEVVDFVDRDAAVGRLRAWIEDRAALDAATELGERLWWLVTPTNPWFPPDLAHRVREVLPRAHVEILDDGPFNRPDLTAAVVRRITTVS